MRFLHRQVVASIHRLLHDFEDLPLLATVLRERMES